VWVHHHEAWTPDWQCNRDDRSNIFRPWGFQTGHLTEWTKLLLQLADRLPSAQRPDWLMPTARHFFDTGLQLGPHDRSPLWRLVPHPHPDNRAYSDDKSPAGKTDHRTMGACWDVLRFMASPRS
jgi:mannose/cellobiose epimerase-like protein (N-acyl-D-glucosamine 2-epimerase family)